MKRPFRSYRQKTASLLPGSREVIEARRPHTWSRRCALEEKKEKKTRNPAEPKTHHEIHSSPATATTPRRRATTYVPRVIRYSPASVDPGFVEIGLVQLSQPVKNTKVAHTLRQTDRQTNRQTDKFNNATRTGPRMKRLFCPIGKKRPRSLASLLVERSLRQGDLILAAAVCVRKNINKNETPSYEIPPHQKHTTKSTAARRPRPPRDGVRRFNALAHTRPLP